MMNRKPLTQNENKCGAFNPDERLIIEKKTYWMKQVSAWGSLWIRPPNIDYFFHSGPRGSKAENELRDTDEHLYKKKKRINK